MLGRTVVGALCFALFLPACTFESSVPIDSEIVCESDAECPAGFRCRTTLGRCVHIDVIDEASPSLAGPALIEPAVGAAGTEFFVTFSVERPLAADPIVWLAAGGELRSLGLEDAGGDGGYTFRYTAAGDEPEGPAALLVDLVDHVGNAAHGLLAGTLTFDFTPPSIVPGSVSLALVPGEENPLRHVTHATAGTQIQVTFTVSEALSVAPSLTAEGPITFALDSAGGAGFTHAFEQTVDADLPPGTYALSASLVDAVGNAATVPVVLPDPGLVIDTVPPSPPDVDTPGRIVHQRVPWGSDATGGLSHQAIRGAPGSAAPGAVVLVLDGPSWPSVELGRAPVGDDGAFGPLDLAIPDRRVLYVAEVDPAGNVSSAAAVRDVVWTATLGGKIAGRAVPNPHRLELRPIHSASALPQVLFEADASMGVHLENGQVARVAGGGRWLSPRTDEPTPRSGAAMTYDPVRGRPLLFGGADNTGPLGDLWEWDGERWGRVVAIDAHGDGAPPARTIHAMTYDWRRGHAVVFGGLSGMTVLGDTWLWNGEGWQLHDPSGARPSPEPRGLSAMAYDPVLGATVLFGGATLGDSMIVAIGDTWVFDGEGWQEIDVGETAPTARYGAAMAFDPVSGGIVLYGGTSDGDDPEATLDDTWRFDGTGWAPVAPSSPSPGPRYGATLAPSGEDGGLVLFGGDESDVTWSWDGSTWTQTSTVDDGAPPPRRHAAATLDVGRGRIVLFGGQGSGTLGDTWLFDDAAWIPRTIDAQPQPRREAGLAFDEARGQTVLFGGRDPDGAPLDDTWIWDGMEWTEVEGAGPPARGQHGMAYDAQRQRIVLHGGTGEGGTLDDTWEWDGATWLDRSADAAAGDAHPPARAALAMAYDPVRAETVTYHGGETWVWDGDAWHDRTESEAPVPEATSQAAMAFDPIAEEILMFGGRYPGDWFCCTSRQTWSWDGAGWTERTPSQATVTQPGSRARAAMAYDPILGRIVLSGGTSFLFQGDPWPWGWDGEQWAPILQNVPGSEYVGALYDHAMVHDVAQAELLVVGGLHPEGQMRAGATRYREARKRPAAVFHLDTAAAGLEGEAAIEHASVRFVVGGAGADGSADAWDGQAPIFGIELLAWIDGRWQVVDTHSAPPESPAPLEAEWSAPSPELSGLFLGGHRTARLAVVPSGVNGILGAEVAVDYLEVALRFRREGAVDP